MELFNFKRNKKIEFNDKLAKMLTASFPKGRADINAGIDELLLILNNKINRDEARNILVKSVAISRISEKFEKEHLISHLNEYCIHHFNDAQINNFFNYLTAIAIAMDIQGSPPSEVKRKGNSYVW